MEGRDFALVGYQRTNKSTGGEVAWQDIVKGYEYEQGKYVALSDGDFRFSSRRNKGRARKCRERRW